MKPRLSKRLHDFPLFAELNDDDRERIRRVGSIRSMEKGRFVFLPGDAPDSVYFLASGRVKISRLSDTGKEFTLDIIEPGGFFGETGVVEERPRECVAEVLEEASLFVVPAAGFRATLEHRPALLMKLARLMGRRRQQLEKRLMDVVYKTAPQRLADLLLELSESYGVRDQRGILLRIKLSQSALGNLLGVSREIVNHTFAGLRRKGVITLAEGRIIIQDPEALAALAA